MQTQTSTSNDIFFDRAAGRFVGITDHDLDVWQQTWRTCDIRTLIQIAEVTVKHQPEVYAPGTIWRRWLCTKVFPYAKELLGAIPLQIENESDSMQKQNPTTVKLSGLVGLDAAKIDVDSHILAHIAPSLSIANKELIGNLMDIGFIKLSRKALNIALHDPRLFNFLCLVAGMARYTTEGFNPHNLQVGQAFIAGSKSVGLTERSYRTVKESAKLQGILRFENKSKGTIATFLSQDFLVTDRQAAENRQAERQAEIQQNKLKDSELTPNGIGKATGRTTGKRQADRQALIYTEEYKKGKKEDLVAAEARRLSASLLEAIRKVKADFKQPDLAKWALDIDRLLRLDKRSAESVQAVIDWLPTDEFWSINILSAAKLRKQFDALELKAAKAKGNAVIEANKRLFQAWKAQYPEQLKAWSVEGHFVKHRWNSKELSLSMSPEAFRDAFEAAAQQR